MEDVFKIMDASGGYITSAMAKKEGRGFYYKLLSLCESGEVVKVKRGLYALPDALANSMGDIDKMVPDGVLCLYSTWFHYGLTTEIPSAFCIAIESKRKVSLPDYPPVDLYYWKGDFLNLGICETEINGFNVRIYDIEKSVCDAVRFRNKIGINVCGEILRNYLKRQDTNIPKLMDYGSRLRISQTLNKYLEIQIWQ